MTNSQSLRSISSNAPSKCYPYLTGRKLRYKEIQQFISYKTKYLCYISTIHRHFQSLQLCHNFFQLFQDRAHDVAHLFLFFDSFIHILNRTWDGYLLFFSAFNPPCFLILGWIFRLFLCTSLMLGKK